MEVQTRSADLMEVIWFKEAPKERTGSLDQVQDPQDPQDQLTHRENLYREATRNSDKRTEMIKRG